MASSEDLGGDYVSVSRADILEIARLLRPYLRSENTVSELLRAIHHFSGAHRAGRMMVAARQMYLQRRARDGQFPKALFGEPGWDMLLALYATADDKKQTVSGLTGLACSSQATALRYMSVLSEEGYLERVAHPSDGRVSFVSLSGKGREAIEGYLASILEPYRR